MNMKQTYSDKLKDLRWQKKRLEILEAAKWQCEDCGKGEADGITLHVHHCHYERGKEPWEYSRNELMAVCEACHDRRSDLEHDAHLALARILRFACDGSPGHASLSELTTDLVHHWDSISDPDSNVSTEDIVFCWEPDYCVGLQATKICKSQGMTWSTLMDAYLEDQKTKPE